MDVPESISALRYWRELFDLILLAWLWMLEVRITKLEDGNV